MLKLKDVKLYKRLKDALDTQNSQSRPASTSSYHPPSVRKTDRDVPGPRPDKWYPEFQAQALKGETGGRRPCFPLWRPVFPCGAP